MQVRQRKRLFDVKEMNSRAIKYVKSNPLPSKSRVRKFNITLSSKQKRRLLEKVLFYSEMLSKEQLLFEKIEGNVNLLSPNAFLPYNTVLKGDFPWSLIKIGNFPTKLLKKEFRALVSSEQIYNLPFSKETESYCYCREGARGEKLVGYALNRL